MLPLLLFLKASEEAIWLLGRCYNGDLFLFLIGARRRGATGSISSVLSNSCMKRDIDDVQQCRAMLQTAYSDSFCLSVYPDLIGCDIARCTSSASLRRHIHARRGAECLQMGSHAGTPRPGSVFLSFYNSIIPTFYRTKFAKIKI